MRIGKLAPIWRPIWRHFKAARGELIIWLTLTRCRREYANEVTRNPLSAIEDLCSQDCAGPSPGKSARELATVPLWPSLVAGPATVSKAARVALGPRRASRCRDMGVRRSCNNYSACTHLNRVVSLECERPSCTN